MKNFSDIKVAVAGTGYVGLSIATLLSQHHEVTAVDVVAEKVDKLNRRVVVQIAGLVAVATTALPACLVERV